MCPTKLASSEWSKAQLNSNFKGIKSVKYGRRAIRCYKIIIIIVGQNFWQMLQFNLKTTDPEENISMLITKVAVRYKSAKLMPNEKI